MTVPGLELLHYRLHISDFPDQKFVVAKLRRVTSAPVQEGTVSDPFASSLGRLADILRLGQSSCNYADLQKIEWLLAEQFQTNAVTEWANYEKVLRRELGVARLEPLASPVPVTANGKVSDLPVTFHDAEMNDRPYIVARVGRIMGSPAPVYLTFPNQVESALARLRDVFKIGVQGQAFKDLAEQGRKLGRREQEIVDEWRDCERAVMR